MDHPTSASFFRVDGTSSGNRSKRQINAQIDCYHRGVPHFCCPTICVFESAPATLGTIEFSVSFTVGSEHPHIGCLATNVLGQCGEVHCVSERGEEHC